VEAQWREALGGGHPFTAISVCTIDSHVCAVYRAKREGHLSGAPSRRLSGLASHPGKLPRAAHHAAPPTAPRMDVTNRAYNAWETVPIVIASRFNPHVPCLTASHRDAEERRACRYSQSVRDGVMGRQASKGNNRT
jgi:hypothetical protein